MVGSGQEFEGNHYVHRFVETARELQHYRSAPFTLQSRLCLIVLWIVRHDDTLVANHDSFYGRKGSQRNLGRAIRDASSPDAFPLAAIAPASHSSRNPSVSAVFPSKGARSW